MKSLLKLWRSLVKLWDLSWAKKWLLLRVVVVLAAYRMLLLFVPFSRFITLTPVSTPQKRVLPDSYVAEQIWAVKVISARLPLGFTCLVQALATKWLLKSHPDARVCVGVRNNETDGFSAHAWLTYRNEIILGEQTGQVFEPILAWN